MVFSSVIFILFFLPVVLGGYFLITKNYRNFFLLITSLVFYFWGENTYLWVIILYIIANYLFGIGIEKARNIERVRIAKYLLWAGLVFNLGLLFFFKYVSFFLANLGSLMGLINVQVPQITTHLPLGISFFAFQGISYVVDIYRKEITAQKNLVDFAMYKAFFGQLIAGPIVRYKEVADQVKQRVITSETFTIGVKRFIVGLAKKMILANTFALTADRIFAMDPGARIWPIAWLGVICYALQIYFDFGGYSDMAIGLGKMFGFTFLENFNYPYIAKSIKEFWRRWHMSLSRWFKDYLYIPLGGDRKGTTRTFFNLILVFFLCGLWHGANFTFIIWGLWYGLFLVIERLPFFNKFGKAPSIIQHCYALLVVFVGWVFFRSESLGQAFSYLGSMFSPSAVPLSSLQPFFTKNLLVMIVIGFIFSTPFIWRRWTTIKAHAGTAHPKWHIAFAVLEGIVFLGLFFACIIILSKNTYNPFIYYQF